MTTFEIAPNPSGGYTAKIDGIDLSRYTRAIRIDLDHDSAFVTLTLIPVQLRGDLPDAVVRLVENDYDDKLADWEKEVLLRQRAAEENDL